MTNSRILLKHGNTIYRFIRIEARPDGSLIVLIDRDPDPKKGSRTFKDGTWHPDIDQVGMVLPHGKYSCHITGQVNRYAGGKFMGNFFIEPLHLLTKVALIGIYSIPKPARLNPYDENIHGGDLVAVVEVPTEIDERISFAFELMPLGAPPLDTHGVILNYEIYALAVRLIEVEVPLDMADHFLEGSPKDGEFDSRQLDIAPAEIGFHLAKNGGRPPIYREKSGAYMVLASTCMRVPPKLEVKFSDPNLSAEQIPFLGDRLPTHKVRFWIKDRGGRNKSLDLRGQIISVALDSEL
jgi:hypothetical protein